MMSAAREKGAKNKVKVREHTFPATPENDLQPAIKTIYSFA